MSYANQMQGAHARTIALGLAAPQMRTGPHIDVAHLFRSVRALDGDSKALAIALATPSQCDVALACARFMLASTAAFQHALGHQATLTVGSMQYDGMRMLSADSGDPQEIRRRASYHLWWSLDSGQIVDMTLSAHLALLKGASPAISPLVGVPANMPQFEWQPWLVGEAVVRQLVNTPAMPSVTPPSQALLRFHR